ncbi:MAG: hypothetical protein IT430_04640 [Phycisphaerales bacterium]|nr:hypothetical protein [Phycisphaerales bacterium]
MTKAYNQSGSYIPSTDAGFKDWLNTFSTLIAADPGKYGLDASDAVIISNLNTQYAAAYQTVQSNSTRTPNSIAQKDALKASATASCRVYAMMIKSNVAVSNDDKLALGIHVDDTTPTPIPAPVTAPLLNIVSAFSGTHQIRYADENTPASRRKPAGAIQIELYVYVATGATANPDDAKFVGAFTKNPILYEFDPVDANKTATYFARWRTQRGLVGPWSLPVAMGIAFGGPVEQQMFVPTGGQPAGGEDELKIAA